MDNTTNPNGTAFNGNYGALVVAGIAATIMIAFIISAAL